MGDFDLLVPRDHAFDALTTLTNVGWSESVREHC
jgi:hypothetical protein